MGRQIRAQCTMRACSIQRPLDAGLPLEASVLYCSERLLLDIA